MSGPSCLPSVPTPLLLTFPQLAHALPSSSSPLIFLLFLLATFLVSTFFTLSHLPFLIPAPRGEALPTCVT